MSCATHVVDGGGGGGVCTGGGSNCGSRRQNIKDNNSRIQSLGSSKVVQLLERLLTIAPTSRSWDDLAHNFQIPWQQYTAASEELEVLLEHA